jgi:uncharacterized membrane protein HdeD (DUF308 family)
MADSITSTTLQMAPEIAHQWGWFLAFGIVLALLGFIAIIRSFAATVVSMVFFGWLLVFAGAIEFIDSFMVGHWAGFFLHLLSAVLFIFIGILFVLRPVLSAEVATFVMSFFFLAGGLYEVVSSLWSHVEGWGWQVFDGVLSMLMGGLLLAQWPLSGLWVIGFFVGIHLLISGLSWITLSLELRKM